jgi:K+-sensing histidine kinase KdpD
VQEQSALPAQEVTQLLRSVADQLKVPLTTIARQAELGQLTGDPAQTDLAAIGVQATAALRLVDCYLLGLQLSQEQTELALEPVSVSSTLVHVAHELKEFARHYDITLEVQVAGKYAPVMAHRVGLQSALLALGYALLEGNPMRHGQLTLAVHRTPRGIVTGIYSGYEQLTAASWRQALELYGRAPQPISALCSGNGAGLFIAEAILRSMSSRLRVGKHRNLQGLAMTLQSSQQLSFV